MVCLSALVLGIVVFYSCSKEESRVNLAEVPNYEVYQAIGVEHNNGLDYVFEQLKAVQEQEGKASFRTKASSSVFALAEQATKDFMAERFEMNAEDLLNTQEHISAMFKHPLRSKSSSNEELNLYDADLKKELSDLQIKLLDDLNLVMSDSDGDLKSLQARIQAIEEEAVVKMEEEEYCIILVATSVAKNTLVYWYENLPKWEELLREGGSFSEKANMVNGAKGVQDGEDTQHNFSWKQVGKTDVLGGVVGGGLGALFMGSASLGTLTIPGWAAGAIQGALGSSVSEALDQIWVIN